MDNNLKLSEKIYLLSIKREKGGIWASASNSISYVLLGALLLELQQNGSIEIRNKRVHILTDRSNDEIHSYLLGKASEFRSERRITYWLRRFNIKRASLKKMLHASLVNKRLISLEHKKFLFFSWDKPHILNSKIQKDLHQEITTNLFRGIKNEEGLKLLLLLSQLNIVHQLYLEKDKRRAARKKLRDLVKSPELSESTKEVVLAVKMSIRAAHAAAAGA